MAHAEGVGRSARWVLFGFWVGVALCAAWMVSQTFAFAHAYEGRILPGAEISGIEVGGKTADEAIAAVGEVVDPQLDRTIRLVHREQVWETTPRQLGATSDAEAAVGEAIARSAAAGWRDHFRMRWLGYGLGYAHGVTVAHDEAAARGLVDRIAGEVDAPVRDASMDYSTGWVQFTPEQVGRSVATGATSADLIAALSDGREVVEVKSLDFEPSRTLGEFGKILFLRQRDHRLYLFQNGQQTHSWLVATGTGGFPTPGGEYSIASKRYMPTWVNPDPEGWGEDMPDMIPPGPSNPLGLRALNWSGGGAIRFHGTSQTWTLGSSASHGCVRLSNVDVVQLYDLVDVGTRIISVR